MMVLESGRHLGLRVSPRWPSSTVWIDAETLSGLRDVQAGLPEELGLILTRGFEPRASRLGCFRRLSRILGRTLFTVLYPRRRHERFAIFGSNGHDADGTHVDVAIAVSGRRLSFLPLSVFTPLAWQRQRVKKYGAAVARVKAELSAKGFLLHRNETESYQIHCDFVQATRPEPPARHGVAVVPGKGGALADS